jgi:hypothetical protein
MLIAAVKAAAELARLAGPRAKRTISPPTPQADDMRFRATKHEMQGSPDAVNAKVG